MDGEHVDGHPPVEQERQQMRHVEQAWAGIDAGKGHHHVVVLDRDGTRVLSRRVVNTEPELIALIDSVITAADELTWAIDLADGPAALLIALLMHREQHLVYLPGIAVNRATAGYRGEGKTDARDAAIIADQARMRRDLRPLRPADPLVLELRMLTTHRADLATDRTRAINRLRGRLVAICPELEAALDFTCHGPLMLIAEFPTAAAIRAVGRDELHRRLRAPKVRNAAALATRAHAAAGQQMRVPGEDVAATQITRLARPVLALNGELAELDARIADRFRAHSTPPCWSAWSGSVTCWVPSSSPPPAVTWPRSPPPITSPATPDSHPPHAIPAAAPGTCTGPAATADSYSASSTPRH
jgi:hypothetical protein